MSDKYLVVYNICELKGRNLEWYVQCLTNILNQSYDNFRVAISGCKVSEATKAGLQLHFGKNLVYNFIDDLYTVNITFNKSVQVFVKALGEHDGYIYVDSGVDFGSNRSILTELNKRTSTGKYGLINLQADTDNGYEAWFKIHPSYIFPEDKVMPVGSAINCHVQYHNNELLKYYGKLIPDIFAAWCTESVSSFLAAALQKKWIILGGIVLAHQKSIDGASGGFGHLGKNGTPWNNLLYDLDMLDIINDPVARKLGLGYEECNQIMMHDQSAFDENGHAKSPELKNYVRDRLFLPKGLLDYETIQCKTII